MEECMKISKKKISYVIGLSLMGLLIGTSSQAAGIQCKAATITQLGAFPDLADDTTHTSKYLVELDCDDDTKWGGAKQFLLTTDLGDSGYASVLTAYSLDKTINVDVASTAFRSHLTRIYIGLPPGYTPIP
jgi:hypothetical protein